MWTQQNGLPKTVQILGQKYTVRKCPHVEPHGECRSESKEIVISDKTTGDMASKTLLHEVVHAVLHESGLSYVLDSTDGLEEAVVRAVEHGLWRAGWRNIRTNSDEL